MSAFGRPRAAHLLLLAGLLVALVAGGCAGPSAAGGTMMGSGSTGYNDAPLSCAGPPGAGGQRVDVVLGDMGMSRMMGGVAPMGSAMRMTVAPAIAAPGKITVVAVNRGWRIHEVLILPLAKGAAAGQHVPAADGRIGETGSLGEASGSCIGGAGDGIDSGSIGWVTVTLAAGRYELLCNLPNHYASGMFRELIVG